MWHRDQIGTRDHRADALPFVGGEHDLGSAHDRARTLNSNLPTAWFAGAWLKIWRGETELGLRYFAHVTRLGLFEPAENIARVFQENFRGGRQGNRALIPLKHLDAEREFQLMNVLADGRLRNE